MACGSGLSYTCGVPFPRVGPPIAAAVSTEIEGRLSILNPHTDRVLMLNETASDIWRLADGEHDLDGLVGLLADAYGVDGAAIRPEVEKVVATLRVEGFLPPLDE